MLQNFSSIKSLHATSPVEQTHTVKGWIKSLRNSKKFSFMVLNDGSSHKDLQIVVDATLENYAAIAALGLHSSVEVTGLVVGSLGKGQSIEMQAKSITIVGTIPEDYPLQKKETSLEFLRENAHLRGRTQLFSAVFRIRHTLSKATHDFFHERGYFYLHTPIITSSDGEGAGEMFRVSTLKPENPPMVSGKVDYSKDYFARETFLNVTGQLEGECYAMALGKIYTFGPTFRAENSNTARHLSEFWMIEPEVAFADLDDVADLGRDYIQFMMKRALEFNRDELEFLAGKNNNPDLIATLEHVASSPFARVTYTEVIDILKKAQAAGHKFEFAAPDWGGDLATEHERYMCEIHFKKPTIVTDYPKDIKAFYMKQNPDGKTVRCMDILVPGVGEIIGGSQREEDYDKLTTRMKEMGLDPAGYWWYTDLRRFGTTPHAGFGLGFERAVMYVTGMTNIRDVIAFPRTPKNAEF